jgi:hypothetical protein
MNCSPLEKLHNEFAEAIKQHAYMGPAKSNPKNLEHTKQKVIRLTEVFRLAREEIELDLKGHNHQGKEISHLRTLQHDGRMFYERYTKETNTWSRSFLKCLARYTPSLLKPLLPSCFSNEMEQAEQETLKEFTTYRDFIREKIKEVAQDDNDEEVESEAGEEATANEEGEIFDPDEDLPVPQKDSKEDTQSLAKPAAKPTERSGSKPTASKDVSSAPKDPVTEKRLQDLRNRRLGRFEGKSPGKGGDDEDPALQRFLLSQYAQDGKSEQDSKGFSIDDCFEDEEIFSEFADDEHEATLSSNNDPKATSAQPTSPIKPPVKVGPPPLSKEELEGTIHKNLQLLNQFDQRPLSLQKMKAVLQSTLSAMSELSKIDSEVQKTLEKLGMNAQTITALKDPQLKEALDKNEDQKGAELLEQTPWQNNFKEAIAQNGFIKFGIRKFAGQKALMLANEAGKNVKEGDFQKYRGEVQINLSDIKALSDLEDLMQYLDKLSSCAPYCLVICLKEDQPLTQEFIQLLLKLKGRVAEVKIEGTKEINFKELALSVDDEYQLIQYLESIQFPQVKKVILSDHPKKSWKTEDFSRLLALCPTMEFLRVCYEQCASYQHIVIPSVMTKAEDLDLHNFSLDHIPHLLSEFPQATYIYMNGLPLTDIQLGTWIKQGYFAHVHALHLRLCKNLTTDCLPALGKLSQLTTLSLPQDLPKGTLLLEKLPKFENPFKIYLLYTASKVTQPLASSLYTGPQHLAAIFQIPLARQETSAVFTSSHKRLDPKSVAYWVYNDEYKKLKPQESILTILADSNAGLNDDNLAEFVQKFPNTVAISLYNCPNVTDAGIMKLLKTCPKITTLDLMGCPHITESLFLGDGHLDILSAQLNQLIITDTGISNDIATTFKETMGAKLVFEEATLKITDDDLTDDDALEKLLKTKNLSTLKRINLEDCTKLTNSMLGQLLDHLNAPAKIVTNKEGTTDNPQRLNLAILNLRGCDNITEEAFHQTKKPASDSESDKDDKQAPVTAKIEPKILGNLDRVIMGGTKISPVLQQVYPQVTFQEYEEPITIQMNPEEQLQECLAYHHLKGQTSLDDLEERELKRLAAAYLHNRITVELFGKDLEGAQKVIDCPVATESEEFGDITLSFRTLDANAKPIVFHAHRDVLYCQSLYFVKGFRPGGKMSKESGLTFESLHATPKAAQAVMDLLYGKPCIDTLDWETAAHVAELIGPHIFNLAKSHYQNLLNHIHKQFDISRAEKMFMAAHLLDDKEGKKEYEDNLLKQLDKLTDKDQRTFRSIAKIANEYSLQKLKDKVAKIEGEQTRKLIKKEIDEQTKEHEQLDREMAQILAEDEEEQAQPFTSVWNVLFGAPRRQGRRRGNP